MSDKRESLILKERAELEAQPFLFAEEDLPKIDRAKPKFHCTGERLFRDRPDVYKAVVRGLAEPGVSVRSICAMCHLSDHTVRSVAAREKISIAAEKERILADLGHVQRLCVDRMIELVPDAPLKDVNLCFGISTDKALLLNHEPTVIFEEAKPINVYEHWKKFLAGEVEGLGGGRLPIKEGELLSDSSVPEIGFADGNLPQKALTHGASQISASGESGNDVGATI
jgi:hypothetical protein